MSLNSTVFKKF